MTPNEMLVCRNSIVERALDKRPRFDADEFASKFGGVTPEVLREAWAVYELIVYRGISRGIFLQ